MIFYIIIFDVRWYYVSNLSIFEKYFRLSKTNLHQMCTLFLQNLLDFFEKHIIVRFIVDLNQSDIRNLSGSCLNIKIFLQNIL